MLRTMLLAGANGHTLTLGLRMTLGSNLKPTCSTYSLRGALQYMLQLSSLLLRLVEMRAVATQAPRVGRKQRRNVLAEKKIWRQSEQ